MACRGTVSFWSIESEGNEGRGHRLRSVVHAIKAVVPSCNKVGTHSLAHANMWSAPTHGEASSPAGPQIHAMLALSSL